MKQFHVVYRKKQRTWAVLRAQRFPCPTCGHVPRAIVTYPIKSLALEHGKKTAKRAKGQLIVHGRDGCIQTEYTYGKDPFPPRG